MRLGEPLALDPASALFAVWLYVNELRGSAAGRTNRSTGNEKMDAVALGLAASMRFEPSALSHDNSERRARITETF